MDLKLTSHSPYILIYFQIGEKKIRVADVLYDSATPFGRTNILPGTEAELVFSIDGDERREMIRFESKVSEEDTIIKFSYLDANKINGRVFSSLH